MHARKKLIPETLKECFCHRAKMCGRIMYHVFANIKRQQGLCWT